MTATLTVDISRIKSAVGLAHFRTALYRDPQRFIANLPRNCWVFRSGDKFPEGVTREEVQRDGYVVIAEYAPAGKVTFKVDGFGESKIVYGVEEPHPVRGARWIMTVTDYEDLWRIFFVDFSDSGENIGLLLTWLESEWKGFFTVIAKEVVPEEFLSSEASPVVEVKPEWKGLITVITQEVVPDSEAKPVVTPKPHPGGSRPASYADKQARSTLVHHLITKWGMSTPAACDLVTNISEKTYRSHRKQEMLLSEAEFLKEWDCPLEEAAQELRGREFRR